MTANGHENDDDLMNAKTPTGQRNGYFVINRLMKIRDIMLEARAPKHGTGRAVPDTLYHGTSLQNFLDIRNNNVFEIDSYQQGNVGFSTTENEAVAIRFARMAAHGERWGVVMTLDGTALARAYHVEAYNDDDEFNTLGDNYEWEWVVHSPTKRIDNAKRFITEVQVLDSQGDRNHLLPWDEAVHGIDLRAAADAAQKSEADGITGLKTAYNKKQAQSALLTLARTHHPTKSTQELRALIVNLADHDLYRMLWLYLRRSPS